MARAWIVDLWVKDARVEMPDGSVQKVTPTAAELKAIKSLPAHFRTAKYGRGKRWRLAWYEDQNGKQVQRAQLFTAKKDAELMQAELEDDIRMGRYVDPAKKSRTFREASEVWLASKKRLKPSSRRRYRRELTNYVLPKWGSTPVGAITREGIDEWVQQLMDGTAPFEFEANGENSVHKRVPGKMAHAYIQHVVGRTFGGTMRYVVAEGWIGRDPNNGVELPRIPARDKEALPSLNYPQVELLADRAGEFTGRDDDKVLALTLMYGGPRIGEATAFRVRNFQHKSRRIRVEQTWTVDEEGKRVLGEPKGWEKRWIPLPKFLADEINELVKNRKPDEFVFQSARGEAINDRNWYNRVWLKVRTAVDASASFSVHDLRHVAATLAIGAGADVKLVQQMLGHKDATETLNTYAALWGDKVDEVARKIEKRRAVALKKAAKKATKKSIEEE